MVTQEAEEAGAEKFRADDVERVCDFQLVERCGSMLIGGRSWLVVSRRYICGPCAQAAVDWLITSVNAGGINMGDLAQKQGLAPIMGLSEAKAKAEDADQHIPKCPRCEQRPESTFGRTIVYLYGVCPGCLRQEGS